MTWLRQRSGIRFPGAPEHNFNRSIFEIQQKLHLGVRIANLPIPRATTHETAATARLFQQGGQRIILRRMAEEAIRHAIPAKVDAGFAAGIA